jgi:phosphate transport system permease protein
VSQSPLPIDDCIRRARRLDLLFRAFAISILVFSLLVLFGLILSLGWTGLARINWSFFTEFPSRHADKAGILSAWVGSLCILAVTASFALPMGVGAGIYLEEYAPKNKLTDFIELNIANLAAVPSVLYGLMALGLFVYMLELGQSIITGGLTLGLLILPIIIVATRESLRAIPIYVREAAFAVGATRWQVVRDHLIPGGIGGILTGVIIALSRAVGETAPLITIGALTFIAFLPSSPFDAFTVMPIQMFNWVSRPQEEFHANAAAAGLVLMVMTLGMNTIAIIARARFRKKVRW